MKKEERQLIEVELGGRKKKIFKGEFDMLIRLGKLKERKGSYKTKEEKEPPEETKGRTIEDGNPPMSKARNLKKAKQ